MASQQHPHRRPKVCHATMHMLSAPRRLTLPHVSPQVLHGFGVRGTEHAPMLLSCLSPSARDASPVFHQSEGDDYLEDGIPHVHMRRAV